MKSRVCGRALVPMLAVFLGVVGTGALGASKVSKPADQASSMVSELWNIIDGGGQLVPSSSPDAFRKGSIYLLDDAFAFVTSSKGHQIVVYPQRRAICEYATVGRAVTSFDRLLALSDRLEDPAWDFPVRPRIEPDGNSCVGSATVSAQILGKIADFLAARSVPQVQQKSDDEEAKKKLEDSVGAIKNVVAKWRFCALMASILEGEKGSERQLKVDEDKISLVTKDGDSVTVTIGGVGGEFHSRDSFLLLFRGVVVSTGNEESSFSAEICATRAEIAQFYKVLGHPCPISEKTSSGDFAEAYHQWRSGLPAGINWRLFGGS